MLERIRLLLRTLSILPKLIAHRPNATGTVTDWIEKRARTAPDRVFVTFEGRSLTFAGLNAAANRVAHTAFGWGLRRGDAVALLMENRPEYISTWAGFAKIGVTTALINTHLSGRALSHALLTANPKALVVGSECLDRLATIAADALGTLPVWVERDPAVAAAAAPPAGALGFDTALAGAPDSNPDPAVREGMRSGDVLFYIYTSGTTGLPKAARLSHMRFLAMGEASAWALGLGPEDVHYCVLPLYHSAGGVMVVSSVLSTGATLALRRKFSASAFWDDVRRTRATCFQYIGELCRYLMNQPARPDDRDHALRVVIGNGLRADIWERFRDRFAIPQIIEFYGATEGNVALMNLENKVGSVGRVPFRWLSNARLIRFDVESDVHVRDGRGLCVECAPGEVGELVGQIPRNESSPLGRFEGYTSKEDSERKILRNVLAAGDAWFRTGDLLRQDAEGFFYFVDRIGDTFRWKGENVSTEEVAGALAGFPRLTTINVYGVLVEGHDGRAGMAALSFADGAGFDGAAFYRFASERLPSYAAPVFVRLVDDAEVTGTFKLRKVTLQEQGFDPRTAAPVFFRDDGAAAYVPLSDDLAAAVRDGGLRV